MKFFAKTKGKHGELYLYDEIGMSWGITPTAVVEALKSIGNVDTLDTFIDSPGGNVFAGLTIHNTLKRFPARKTVIVDGIAASIASYIAMAGDEIRIASNGRFMIHEAWGPLAGSAKDHRNIADKLDEITGTILDGYVDRTKGSRDQIKAWMEEETWMRAPEALARGFADSIDDVTTRVENSDSSLYAKYRHTPEDLMKRAKSTEALRAKMEMRTSSIRRVSPATA